MESAVTSDNHGQLPDSPLGQLAAALIDRGFDPSLSVEPAGPRTAETLHVVLNGHLAQIWECGANFLTGCWQAIGPTARPAETADRLAGFRVG